MTRASKPRGARSMLLLWPLLVFVLSAVSSLMTAYDATAAAAKFALIAAGLLVAYGLARLPSRVVWRAREIALFRIGIAAVPALIAVYFLLTSDWAGPVDKVSWLDPVQHLLASAQIRHSFPALHPNVVGGLLAMLLPLQSAALFVRSDAPARAPGCTPWWKIGLLMLSLTALMLTRLRGAWVALAAAGAIWLAFRAQLWVRRTGSRAGRFRSVALAGALVPLVLLTAGCVSEWTTARPDRLFVWSTSLHLAREYVFTGLGLGSFTMPYSSYAVLLHVPHTTHAHNLFLNIWLEQGLLGLFAFLWIVTVAVVPPFLGARQLLAHPDRRAGRWWQTAALISTFVLILHGLIDDSYYGYGGLGSVLLFVPLGLLARDQGPPRLCTASNFTLITSRGFVGAIVAAAIASIAALPATRGMYHANLGALQQTRAELAVYRWPTWAVQDEVRRANAAKLSPAVDHFHAALALNPNDRVAHQRLGQIELSLGEYELARMHLEAAHRASPAHHATRQLLGESRALTGDVDGAALLWRSIPLDFGQLGVRLAWYERTADATLVSWLQESIAKAQTLGP